jgi:sporulation protein YlmC with PRC-barrel domain
MDKYVRLSQNNDWSLVNESQDIRNWKVYDAAGESVGHVSDMVINTNTEEVEEIILNDGTRYPTQDIRIGDGTVYIENYFVSGSPTDKTVTSKYERLQPIRMRRQPATTEVFDETTGYRDHYVATYEDSGMTYEEMEPAYSFGAEMARESKYAGRGYTDVERDLRSMYESRFSDRSASRPYTDVDQAIRYGFERINRTGRRSDRPGADLTSTGRSKTIASSH